MRGQQAVRYSTGAKAVSRCRTKPAEPTKAMGPSSLSARFPTSSRPRHTLNSAWMACVAGSRQQWNARRSWMVEDAARPLGGRHILVVEDDYMIAADLARSLEDL